MPQVILDFISAHHIPVSASEARAIWISHRGSVWKTLNSLRAFESNSRFVYAAEAQSVYNAKVALQKIAAEAETARALTVALNKPAHARKKIDIKALLND